MRVAVVDIGTNTTRVLVADVEDGRVHELERRTKVTRLPFLGATAARPPGAGPFVVIDIGGGSTEYVVGHAGGPPAFSVSTQAGSVRQTERHLHEDPPSDEDLATLRAAIRSIIDDAI